MQAGTITLVWDRDGVLDIKTTLPMTADNRKVIINVLLDAARAMNQTGSDRLMVPVGAQIRTG